MKTKFKIYLVMIGDLEIVLYHLKPVQGCLLLGYQLEKVCID